MSDGHPLGPASDSEPGGQAPEPGVGAVPPPPDEAAPAPPGEAPQPPDLPDGQSPPPGAGPEPADVPDGTAPSPPGGRGQRLVVIGLAGGVAAAVIAVVLALLLTGGATTYTIVVPASAGGWHRNQALGPPRLSKASIRSSQIQKVLSNKAVAGVTAIYGNPANPEQEVIFTGATGNFGDPSHLLANLRANPGSVSKILKVTVAWRSVAAGPHGGDAACGEYSANVGVARVRISVCAWQTASSFGELVELPRSGAALDPNAPHLSEIALARQMLRMRPDLEKAK